MNVEVAQVCVLSYAAMMCCITAETNCMVAEGGPTEPALRYAPPSPLRRPASPRPPEPVPSSSRPALPDLPLERTPDSPPAYSQLQ